MKKQIFLYFFIAVAIFEMAIIEGCANIIPPLGGPRDSLPPVLIRSLPVQDAINFQGKTITLEFNEYVTVDNPYQNVIVSPNPQKFPLITGKLRDVTIKIWDTLEPNTTYSFNFGNSIKDVNEGNIYKNFTYVFSTGRTIDSLTLTGKVILAETGKVDSTLIVLLHRNLDDSAVAKDKARFLAKVDGKGNFKFPNLPAGKYGLFALKDDGFKKYTDNSILFAFAGAPIQIGEENKPVNLYAFVGEKEKPKNKTTSTTANPFAKATAPKEEKKEDKRLRFQLNLQEGEQDLLGDLRVTFSKPLKSLDSSKFILADEKYNPIPNVRLEMDSTNKTVIVRQPWREKVFYKLVLVKGVATDSAGNTTSRNDTIPFKTKSESAYGTISRLYFKNLDLSKHPVLQWVSNDAIIKSYPLTSNIWKARLFEPGTYEIRILYDDNQNGKWDTGNYWKKIQPEKVFTIPQKIEIRANIDKEFNIEYNLTP